MSSALSAGETRWRSWPRIRAILDDSGSEGDMVVSDVSSSPGAYTSAPRRNRWAGAVIESSARADIDAAYDWIKERAPLAAINADRRPSRNRIGSVPGPVARQARST